MTFEWILEENSLKVPKPFLEKMNLLNKASDLPSLFRNRPDLYKFTKVLFSQLVPYRNEVVHKNRFAVSGDSLTLSNSRKGTTLTLSSKETNSLVRFARMLIHALGGKIVVDDCKYKMFCYDLNVLQPVHGLRAFVQERFSFRACQIQRAQAGYRLPRRSQTSARYARPYIPDPGGCSSTLKCGPKRARISLHSGIFHRRKSPIWT